MIIIRKHYKIRTEAHLDDKYSRGRYALEINLLNKLTQKRSNKRTLAHTH